MTEATKLATDLKAHFRGHSFGVGNPWQDLLPRLYAALEELDQRQQQGPAFIAIPRVSRHGPEVKRDGE